MPRIKIELPEKFSFITNIPVRISDLNYGGHVGNDTILSIVHEARIRFLMHLGYSEINFGGTGLIMSDAGIEFKNEAFYGDVISVSIKATEFTRVAFELYYKLEKESDGSKVLIAAVKTGMVCFDYTTRKVTPVPETVKEKLLAC